MRQANSLSKQSSNKLTLKQWLGRLLLAGLDLYVVYPSAHLILRALTGDRLWPIALMNNLLHWWLLFSFPLLALMLWQRRWWGAGLAGLNVVFFLWLFGGLFFPNLHTPDLPAGNADTLTVMAYNVGSGWAQPDDLIAALQDSGADVVALLEVAPWQADELSEALEDLYPYRVLYGYGVTGKGLLSRYPILEEELFSLPTSHMTHLRATLNVDGMPLNLIAAHPPRPHIGRGGFYYSRGHDDIVTLAEMAASADGPTIMLGDFNTSDLGEDYALVANTGLTDAFRVAGWGFGLTFPNRPLPFRPVTRIDYIWYSEHFYAVRAWVGPDAGSDHLPVLAELVWTQEAEE